jgi:hypothetical protein
MDYGFSLALSPNERTVYVSGILDNFGFPPPFGSHLNDLWIAAFESASIPPAFPPAPVPPPGVQLDRNAFAPAIGETLEILVKTEGMAPPEVKVYTASGRLVITLDAVVAVEPRLWRAIWNGRVRSGGLAARGVYLVRVVRDNRAETVKVVIK